MNEAQQQLQQVEITIEQAESYIKRAECLARLYNNKDFKKIIVEGYLKEDVIRMVMLKGDPNMESEDRQKQVNLAIDGMSSLNQHFAMVRSFGTRAQEDLAAYRETRDALSEEAL